MAENVTISRDLARKIDNAGRATTFAAGDLLAVHRYTDQGQPDLRLIPPGAVGGEAVIPADAETGQIERSVATVLSDSVNVKNFGALGDGTTVDTVAIQAAIDRAATLNAEVFFPGGTYITGLLTIPSGCRLRGSGIEKTRLHRTTDVVILNAIGDASTGTDFTVTIYGVTISDMSLRNMASGSTAPIAKFWGAGACYFERVRFQSFSDGAPLIDCMQVWDSKFTNCMFHGGGSATGPVGAVRLRAGTSGYGQTKETFFANCWWEAYIGPGIEISRPDGYFTTKCEMIHFTNCKMESQTCTTSHIVMSGNSCNFTSFYISFKLTAGPIVDLVNSKGLQGAIGFYYIAGTTPSSLVNVSVNSWNIDLRVKVMVASQPTNANLVTLAIIDDSRNNIVITGETQKLINGAQRATGDLVTTAFRRLPSTSFGELPFSVYRATDGTYRSDFDYDSHIAQITGTTYYVDPFNTTGVASDANSGLTVALPLLSPKAALGKSDRGRILIRGGPGYLGRTAAGQFDPVTWGTAPVSMEAWGGPVKFINGNVGNTLTWASEGSGAYSTTLSGVMGVLNTSFTDPLVPSLPLPYTARADLAAVQGAAEGWATSGTTVYVKTVAGTSPSLANIFVLRSAFTLTSCTASLLYMRGIHFIGIAGGMRHKLTTYNPQARTILVDCVSAYTSAAGDYDAVGIDNVGVAALKNCQAYYGGKDCFNFHATDVATARTAQPVALLENCTSKYPAWQRAEVRGPYQAATSHDAIRSVHLNPTYGPTLGGPPLQDQGTSGFECYSWTLGGTVSSVGSPATAGELSVVWGYTVLGGLYSSMWLQDVTLTEGDAGPIYANTDSPVRVRGTPTAWTAATVGNVGPY
jgi:hypothetical protein